MHINFFLVPLPGQRVPGSITTDNVLSLVYVDCTSVDGSTQSRASPAVLNG